MPRRVATSSAAWSRPLSPEGAPSLLRRAGVARVLVFVAGEVGREAGVQALCSCADHGGLDPGAQIHLHPRGSDELDHGIEPCEAVARDLVGWTAISAPALTSKACSGSLSAVRSSVKPPRRTRMAFSKIPAPTLLSMSQCRVYSPDSGRSRSRRGASRGWTGLAGQARRHLVVRLPWIAARPRSL